MRQTKLLRTAKRVDRDSLNAAGLFFGAMRHEGIPDRKISAIKEIVTLGEHPALADRDVRVLALLFLNEMSLSGDLA